MQCVRNTTIGAPINDYSVNYSACVFTAFDRTPVGLSTGSSGSDKECQLNSANKITHCEPGKTTNYCNEVTIILQCQLPRAITIFKVVLKQFMI